MKGYEMRAYERLIEYAKIPTMSNEESESTPSSKKQLVLAKRLEGELKALGLTDARVDSFGYVYASLAANTDGAPTIGLIAHLDTSPAVSDEGISPRVIKYDGGDILLNEEDGTVMSAEVFKNLEGHIGEHLVVTDGRTLLGADDKAGIAEIITALEEIISEDIPHGKIAIAFTPDEEIGRGADHFDVAAFGADFAYTLDGGSLGEIGYENFNAATARLTVCGVSEHPGSAKGRMKNAIRILSEFDSLLPSEEIPELTCDREGFHHLTDMSGGIEHAESTYIIRDHDDRKFEAKKALFKEKAELINEKYGNALTLEIKDTYYNVRRRIEKSPHVIERARAAMAALGIEAHESPIRGGTDGARLTFMGLPCPNLCTGGENFHSRFEFASVEAMDKTVELIKKIVTKTA